MEADASVPQDYGAPVAESRELTAKYSELKLQSFFLRSFPDFRMTNLISKKHYGLIFAET